MRIPYSLELENNEFEPQVSSFMMVYKFLTLQRCALVGWQKVKN